jgi:thiopeptide-type bacteriocin biosynthesis protein
MNYFVLKRSFILGEDWLYIKFYSGAQTADIILNEAIKPAVIQLLSKNKIDQWFFIRYADPDLHLRVRLLISKPSSIGIIIRTINKFIRKFVDQELIWKVQTDTYNREIERYGSHTMELSEKLFFLDSTLFLNVLPQFRNQQGEIQRWHFTLKSIDNLLDCFRFSNEQKLRLLGTLKLNFGEEFGINRSLKDQLNIKFSKEWKGIEKSMNYETENDSVISTLLDSLLVHRKKMTPVADEIILTLQQYPGEVILNELIASYIHMMMNRYFRSKQRVHELVLYDFLFRYYKSTIARLKATELSQTKVFLK